MSRRSESDASLQISDTADNRSQGSRISRGNRSESSREKRAEYDILAPFEAFTGCGSGSEYKELPASDKDVNIDDKGLSDTSVSAEERLLRATFMIKSLQRSLSMKEHIIATMQRDMDEDSRLSKNIVDRLEYSFMKRQSELVNRHEIIINRLESQLSAYRHEDGLMYITFAQNALQEYLTSNSFTMFSTHGSSGKKSAVRALRSLGRLQEQFIKKNMSSDELKGQIKSCLERFCEGSGTAPGSRHAFAHAALEQIENIREVLLPIDQRMRPITQTEFWRRWQQSTKTERLEIISPRIRF